MKKFLIAAAASLIIFSGQTEASTVERLDKPIERQEVGKWAHFRDKYLLGRETENESKDRKEWERNHRYDYSKRRDDRRYYPPSPPPPPYYRNGKRYYPPPSPAPNYRDGKRYYPPSPPPPRYR